MALRTSKITSEIIQSCNKLMSSSAEVTLRHKLPATPTNNQRPFRYKIANTEKPEGLPELNFQENDEGTSLFAELQPAANPEFRFEYPAKWAEKPSNNSPFPQTIKENNKMHAPYTDMQKAEDKFVKFKLASFNPSTRNYSTISKRYYGRNPADNNSAANCGKKIDKCVKVQKQCKINVNKNCPRFKIHDCPQSKGSKCELRYLDPHCTKKFAPYPAYSESCVEHMPEDPSECEQCPWRTCDGADDIKPGKPVRHKRHYSTSTHRHLDAMGGVVVGPYFPPPLGEVQEHIVCKGGKCGQVKSPCKEPPGKCKERKEIEERQREERKHRGGSKKKASDMDGRMVLLSNPAGGQDVVVNPYTLEPVNMILDEPGALRKDSWIDITNEKQTILLKKNKYPHCDKKKKPKKPPGPEQMLFAKPEMLLKGKHKKIKGDEGHPPPCPDDTQGSLRCPEKPIKKPKYKKRPATHPYYKKPEDPYNPSQ